MNVQLAADLEGVIDGICDGLLSPTFLDRLRHEWEGRSVAVALRYPEVVYSDEIETPSGYPCCEVIAVREATNQETDAEDVTHELSVQWTINGDNEEVMTRQLRRYMRATRRFLAGGYLKPFVDSGPIRIGDVDYGLTAQARTGTTGVNARYIKTASLQVFVQTVGER